MERQTRHLLGALADELNGELLEALAAGTALETELQQVVGASRQTVNRRLGELEALGLVLGKRRPTPGRGRPTRSWSLASSRVLAFLEETEQFQLALLEEQVKRHRAALGSDAVGGEVRRLRA
jgi:predicted ArsR family transcriptional regulator